MGEVVNLNQYRKKRERLERKKAAAANRVRFGRRKEDVKRSKRERERERTELDAKALKDSDDTPEAG